MWLAVPVAVQAAEPGYLPQRTMEAVDGQRPRPGVNALAHSPTWRRLLHMPLAGHGAPRSRVDSVDFFLHPRGQTDPVAELQANITALRQPPGADGAHYACRFPVRSAWLRRMLEKALQESQLARLPEPDCASLQHWRARLRSERLTLVFASAYLNNPSSMFGHTLLRLDRGEAGESALLSWAVNFAAQTTDEHGFGFAYKGLTGGYPGRFGIYPYYDKVQAYARIENRDLWEYELSLSPGEISRLIDHLWELRKVDFDYFFLKENCSFQLLALLEVARPELELTAQFGPWAAPVDTIRALRAEAGLVARVVHRPSLYTALSQRISELGEDEQEALLHLLQGRDPVPGWSQPQQAELAELAYDWARYQQNNNAWISGGRAHAPDAMQALADAMALWRSGMPLVSTERSETNAVPASPDQGHRGNRLQFGQTWAGGVSAALLGWRPRLHDVLDPDRGVAPGQGISVLDGVFSLSGQRLRLNELQLIRIVSHGLRDPYFQPWSWQLGLAYRRQHVEAHGFLEADAQLGGDWALTHGGQRRWVMQVAGRGALLTGLRDGERAPTLALGPSLSLWLRPSTSWATHVSAYYLGSLVSPSDKGLRRQHRGHRRGWRIEQQYSPSVQWGLRWSIYRLDQPVGTGIDMRLMRYF